MLAESTLVTTERVSVSRTTSFAIVTTTESVAQNALMASTRPDGPGPAVTAELPFWDPRKDVPKS